MENKKSINNMDYVLVGDYYIPDLKLPNEELKADDQMAWIRAMNSIHNRAEEIMLEKIVYR